MHARTRTRPVALAAGLLIAALAFPGIAHRGHVAAKAHHGGVDVAAVAQR